jgi:hypothetical protein
MPLSDGEGSQVLPSELGCSFSLVKEGIYFIPGPPFRKSSIQFLSFVTGEVKTVAPLSAPVFEGLSFSPDGRSLLADRRNSQRPDAGRELPVRL